MEIAEEIIREIPKGLLRWYSFKKNSRVLYIGEEDCLLEWLKENKSSSNVCLTNSCKGKVIRRHSLEDIKTFHTSLIIE